MLSTHVAVWWQEAEHRRTVLRQLGWRCKAQAGLGCSAQAGLRQLFTVKAWHHSCSRTVVFHSWRAHLPCNVPLCAALQISSGALAAALQQLADSDEEGDESDEDAGGYDADSIYGPPEVSRRGGEAGRGGRSWSVVQA